MRRRIGFSGRPKGQGRLLSGSRGLILLLAVLTLLTALYITAARYLKELASAMALSDASDLITITVNEAVNKRLSESDIDYDYFVTLEKDVNGRISAIKSNMNNINLLSSEILNDIVDATESGELDIHIPVGNLLGSNLLSGKGPKIPVKIIMLTSSRADFRNELVASGINQTKHQIILEISVDIDVLIPWDTASTQVKVEVLVAETVIVGEVPETYVNMEP